MNSVVDGQNEGLSIHCGTIMASKVRSIEELKVDDDPLRYNYHDGLIKELQKHHNTMFRFFFYKW
jgi:hypothetical protein